MAREWIALERHEGRAHDLSLYARALHAQLHRWVDGEGRIPARLEGDLPDAMARSLAFRFGATKGDRRLIAGHLRELVDVGAVVLSADGLELRALADGADLVRHKLAIGDRSKRASTSTKSDEPSTNGDERLRTVNEPPRTATRSDASAQNDSVHVPRGEYIRSNEKTEDLPSVGPRAPEALTLSTAAEPKTERKAKRAAQSNADVEPAEGTLARKVYEIVTTDRAFAGLVRPGDFAVRVCADGAYPGVNVVAEVRAAGAWAAGKSRAPWRNVRSGLLGWLRRAAEEARQSASTARVAPTVVRPVRAPVPAIPEPAKRMSAEDVSAFRKRLAEQRAGLVSVDELPRAAGGER